MAGLYVGRSFPRSLQRRAEQMERADTPSLVLAPMAGVRTPRTILFRPLLSNIEVIPQIQQFFQLCYINGSVLECSVRLHFFEKKSWSLFH